MLKRKSDGGYIRGQSSVKTMKHLRRILLEIPNIEIKKMEPCDDVEELLHVYKECGLDDIELDEKD